LFCGAGGSTAVPAQLAVTSRAAKAADASSAGTNLAWRGCPGFLFAPETPPAIPNIPNIPASPSAKIHSAPRVDDGGAGFVTRGVDIVPPPDAAGA